MVNALTGHTSKVEFLRVQFWERCFFCFTSMIYLILHQWFYNKSKLFRHDTSFFSVARNYAATSASLNDKLLKMSGWAYL